MKCPTFREKKICSKRIQKITSTGGLNFCNFSNTFTSDVYGVHPTLLDHSSATSVRRSHWRVWNLSDVNGTCNICWRWHEEISRYIEIWKQFELHLNTFVFCFKWVYNNTLCKPSGFMKKINKIYESLNNVFVTGENIYRYSSINP